MDSSRDLQPIYAKSFINRLHLVLHACVKIFDVIFFFAFTEFTGKKGLLAGVVAVASTTSSSWRQGDGDKPKPARR